MIRSSLTFIILLKINLVIIMFLNGSQCAVNITLALHSESLVLWPFSSAVFDRGLVAGCKDSIGWMFSKLDTSNDLFLDQSELAAINLEKYEVCIRPFFNSCDSYRDGKVSTAEWCLCFWRESESVFTRSLFKSLHFILISKKSVIFIVIYYCVFYLFVFNHFALDKWNEYKMCDLRDGLLSLVDDLSSFPVFPRTSVFGWNRADSDTGGV